MVRLGCGTGESNARMQSALDVLSPTAGMLFEPPDHSIPPTESFCCGREELFQEWNASVTDTLAKCGLSASMTLPPQSRVGGRRGGHAAHFVEQQFEMTEVRRAEPAPAW
jgi:1,2-phenylacetyl-CoA epoxidase catalytic subunit